MTNLLMVNSIPASGRDFVPNAQDISDKLASLRDLLVQQMHSGIEPAVPTSEPESSSEDNSFSNSDYQESESVKILSAPSHQQSNSSAFVHNALKKNKILQDKIKHMLLKLDDEIRVCSQKIVHPRLFVISSLLCKYLFFHFPPF